MSSKIAKLSEHDSVKSLIEPAEIEITGNGELPAFCSCSGKLDFAIRGFTTKDRQYVLVCRDCHRTIELD